MNKISKWYEKTGEKSDVVCSTRIRLARNLRDYPFPEKNTPKQKKEIAEKVKMAVLSASEIMKDTFSVIELENLNQNELISFVERHTVSPEFISDLKGKELILSHDERISIMINEEDHIRIQVIHEGFALKQALEIADRLDSLLAERLDFAFDDRLGYLTHCPTNLGTGMRASLMLHLPAMSEFGVVQMMAGNLSKLGITIRGSFGEGTKVAGCMYQLSNRITLGLSEEEAVENLESIAVQVMLQEKKLRGEMLNNIVVQDKISRSAGTMKSARILTLSECMECLSYIRLGVSESFIDGMNLAEINRLWANVQPATISVQADKEFSSQEIDFERGKLTREICKDIKE